MNKHKTKFIFECTAPKELTEFNENYNKAIKNYCDRKEFFKPTIQCTEHSIDGGRCQFLKLHTYK